MAITEAMGLMCKGTTELLRITLFTITTVPTLMSIHIPDKLAPFTTITTITAIVITTTISTVTHTITTIPITPSQEQLTITTVNCQTKKLEL